MADAEIEAFSPKRVMPHSNIDKQAAYKGASFVVVAATPTNYDPDTNRFDTSSVDSVVGDALEQNSDALVVIKSTIPVGHTNHCKKSTTHNHAIFSLRVLARGSGAQR